MNEHEQWDQIAEEFANEIRAGNQPSLDAFLSRASDGDGTPASRAELKQLLESVQVIEGLKSPSSSIRNQPSPNLSKLQVGQLVDDYRIVREIGRGGMGVVYEAVHQSLARRVALKVLNSGLLSEAKHVARFRIEARAAARLRHSNIVSVFGVGSTETLYYYVMDFIDGESLRQRLNRLANGNATSSQTVADRRPSSTTPAATVSTKPVYTDSFSGPKTDLKSELEFDAPEDLVGLESDRHTPSLGDSEHFRWAANIACQMAGALAYAHERGVLHRDIKPANLLIDSQSQVWLADFGLAKLIENQDVTQTGDMLGTPQYMPPESFEGTYDVTSEIYALGLTLFELLTLQPGVDAGSPAETIRNAIRGPSRTVRQVNPNIPRDLDTIVQKAIAHSPQDRYPSAKLLQEDLELFLADVPIRARRVSLFEKTLRWSRREPLAATLTATTFLLLCALTVVSASGYFITKKSLTRANKATKEANEARDKASAALEATELEAARAEATVSKALLAFDALLANVASRGIEDDPELFGEATERIAANVDRKDAEQLQILLSFFEDLTKLSNSQRTEETASAAKNAAEIYLNLGLLSKALSAYRTADRLFTGIVKEDPSQANALSLAEVKIALLSIARVRRDFRSAEDQFDSVNQLFATLSLSDTPELQIELGRAHRIYSGIKAASLDRPRRLITVWSPENRLANSPPYSPAIRMNAELALKLLDEAIAILEGAKTSATLSGDAKNGIGSRAELELARCFREKGAILMQSRKDAGLMDASFDEATNILLRLANRNGEQKGIMEYELALTTLQSFRETSRRAPERVASAVRLARGFVQSAPDVPKYQSLLALALEKSGRVAFVQNEMDKAKTDFEEAIGIYRRLLDETPNQPNYRLRLATSEIFLARTAHQNGDSEFARKIFEGVIRKSRESFGPGGRRWKPPPQIEAFMNDLQNELDSPKSPPRQRRRNAGPN